MQGPKVAPAAAPVSSMTEATMRTKLLAALALVAVSTTVGVLYKVSQGVSKGVILVKIPVHGIDYGKLLADQELRPQLEVAIKGVITEGGGIDAERVVLVISSGSAEATISPPAGSHAKLISKLSSSQEALAQMVKTRVSAIPRIADIRNGIIDAVVEVQAKDGFHYSTTSAIAIAEVAKLCMSISFHIGDTSHHTDPHASRAASAWAAVKSQLSSRAVGHIWLLAGLYMVNNQLSFYVYMLADPGTIFLFKAGSTMIVATIQCLCVGKDFTADQWKAMFLQGVGMVIVQYNPCKSGTRYRPLAYLLMIVSTVLTALCAVRNEYLVKNYKVGLHVQNAVLYSGGACMNLFAFFFLPNPNSAQAKLGFFDGYDNPMALGVVFSNAMIGLAITAVYKYADAVTKCIASDITAVLLCIVSAIFFELTPSITMWCGVIVVCFAVHLYVGAAPSPPKPAPSQRQPDPEAVDSPATKDLQPDGTRASLSDQELTTLLGRKAEATMADR